MTATEILQQKLNAIRTMSANFTQIIEADHRELSRSSGVMALQRPGKFRWQTKQPMPQVVVADSLKLWVYDEELEQVTVKKQEKGIGDTAGLFLSGDNHTIAHDFKVKHLVKSERDYFYLYPNKKNSHFSKVILVFVGDHLQGIILYDQLGQKTDVRLLQVKNNKSLSQTLFQFKIPKGVDVVEQ